MNGKATLRMLGCLAIATLGLSTFTQAGPISKRIENQIKSKVVPAYRQDDWEGFEKILTNWISKFDAKELDEIDKLLQTNGVPSVGRLILDARVAQLLSGDANKKVLPRELTRSMPVLHERVNEVVHEVKDSEFFAATLPDYQGMQDYHDAFWEIHVAKNELRTAARSARYGQKTIEQVKQSKLRGLTKDELATLDIDFAAQANSIVKAVDELDEIKTELQILALGKAAKVVRESDDYKERLRAAYVIEFSSDPVLDSLRKKNPKEYDRPLLKDERLLNSVETSIRYARESAGDLTTQARLLYLGMHWWMRGRYGQGPDGMGLLKSIHSLRSAEAQFPLYMPVDPPEPTEPSSYGSSIPKFDRRHHYIWMYEYRTILTNIENTNRRSSSGTHDISSKTKLDRFY